MKKPINYVVNTKKNITETTDFTNYYAATKYKIRKINMENKKLWSWYW